MSVPASKLSMIIDGIAASEAIDSSGEILDVKGCDITDFENGVGTLNWEHRGDDANGASGNDTVGKIIYAKKIFKKDDCEDKRQEAYWEHVKLPFVYIKARLFDGADHSGAKAVAAIIRDSVMHNEPILARFSIEGSTLKKEGQKLSRTIARKVAVTLKPANKSAISGLVSDPNGPKPITEKQAEKSLLSRLLDEETIKNERPGQQKLGGYEMAYTNIEVNGLSKTMTGGVGDAAPSTLTGGAALVREDIMGLTDKEKVKNHIRGAIRDYDPERHGYKKSDLLKYLQAELPMVNPQFLDHFTDLVGDVRTKQVGEWFDKAMGVWGAVQKAEERGREQALGALATPEPPAASVADEGPKVEYTPRPEAENPLEVPPPTKRGVGLSDSGELLSQALTQKNLKLKLYDYSQDPHFMSVLHADDERKSPLLDPTRRQLIVNYVHKPWQRAMSNWMVLNKMASEGALPPSVIAHAAIFAAMSPNTSVPIQELYYGHYMDFRKLHGDVFSNPAGIKPEDAEYFHRWLNKTTPPDFFREFYVKQGKEKGGVSFEDRKSASSPGSTLAKRPQGMGLLNYHRFHPFMVALQRQVKDDGRSFVDYIMQQKEEGGRTSFMPGFGPKLARYMGLMMGQGNMIVPDRHQLRALFNLEDSQADQAEYAFNTLTPVRGERLLRGIDHHFFQKAPAVHKVLETWPDHFKGRETQAVGPAFWLQWLAYPHYENLLGRPTDNLNMGTAHDPFFKSVAQIMDEEGIPHDFTDPSKMWDVKKSQDQYSRSLASRVASATKRVEQTFGAGPATFFFYAWGAQALMAHENAFSYGDEAQIRKMEYIAIEGRRLFKAAADKLVEKPAEQWPPQEAPVVMHKGKKLKAGFATVHFNTNGSRAEGGRKMAIIGKAPIHEDAPLGEWLMVPHERLKDFGPEHMERWNIDGTAEIHQEPEDIDLPVGTVDADAHVPPHFLMNDYQRSMVHGLNLQAAQQEAPPHFEHGVSSGRWLQLPNGKEAFVKTNGTARANHSSAHNEVVVHNMMHWLGLGKHVAPTVAFQDPTRPTNEEPTAADWWSAHEAIPNPSHYNYLHDDHDSTLTDMLHTGSLHKLVMADQILGVGDRHDHNFMFGGDQGKNLYVIDHGDALPASGGGEIPAYWHAAIDAAQDRGHIFDSRDIKLHPEAKKWLMGIDQEQLGTQLANHHVPLPSIAAAKKRLRALQEYATVEPDASMDEVLGYPMARHSGFPLMYDLAAKDRAFKDPEFAKRYEQYHKDNYQSSDKSAEAENDYTNAFRTAVAKYEDAIRNDEDTEPYQLLAESLGHKGAEDVIKNFGSEMGLSHDKAIEYFNSHVRKSGNQRHRRALRARDHTGESLARAIAENKDPVTELLSKLNVDELGKQLHAPHPGEDEGARQYGERILQMLQPHINKHLPLVRRG